MEEQHKPKKRKGKGKGDKQPNAAANDWSRQGMQAERHANTYKHTRARLREAGEAVNSRTRGRKRGKEGEKAGQDDANAVMVNVQRGEPTGGGGRRAS